MHVLLVHASERRFLAYVTPILLCPYHSGISHLTLEGGEGKREREEGKDGRKGESGRGYKHKHMYIYIT